MILVSVHIPEKYMEAMEDLVTARYFPNRAEVIRTAIRDLIKSEFYKQREEEVLALKEKFGLRV